MPSAQQAQTEAHTAMTLQRLLLRMPGTSSVSVIPRLISEIGSSLPADHALSQLPEQLLGQLPEQRLSLQGMGLWTERQAEAEVQSQQQQQQISQAMLLRIPWDHLIPIDATPPSQPPSPLPVRAATSSPPGRLIRLSHMALSHMVLPATASTSSALRGAEPRSAPSTMAPIRSMLLTWPRQVWCRMG